MLGSFFDDLLGQFPDDEEVVAAHERISSTPAEEAGDAAMEAFVRALGPTGAAKLQNKDQSVFEGLVIEGVDLGRLWKLDMHDQSRAAIFQYLGFLNTIAQTLRAIPPELMQTIEATAKGLAAQFSAGGSGGMPDVGSLMNMFSNLGGPGGLGGLSGLGGLGGLLGDLSSASESTPPRNRARAALPPSAPARGPRNGKRKH
jgi:hypothetical protein